jgi:Zn-dependent M28 family amino/carboxypeptidase
MGFEIKPICHRSDACGFIADKKGFEEANKILMVMGHVDSVGEDFAGADDNASGAAVMLEMARLLSTYKNKKTIRFFITNGEEQGLLGSRAYVKNHFGETPEGDAKRAKISAYYNLDNGTGKIRGIYTQGNDKIAPIFNSLLQPFKDLGAATVTYSNTGGTDHQSFDGVGIPGFQFIQEPIAYSTRTHHSNMDNWDHLIADDLKQAATVIASIVLHTAMRDELMPRK